VEGHLWQLFIFDDHLYVQPYLAARKNSREAPVLKFSRFGPSGSPSDGGQVTLGENHRSLYHAFSRYFDLKWDESRPESTSLDELIAEPERAVVAGCLKTRAGQYVFVIPRRYLAENGRDIRYHCPGGKPTAGEGLVAALHRELREELGVEVDVVSSQLVTRYVTSYVEQKPLRVTDKPQPAIVYNRIREDDPNLGSSDQWIVAWDVSLRPADEGEPSKIRPRSEIGAVLYLSPELLNATATRRVSYREIQGAKDGSKLVVMQGLGFDAEKSAVPTGVASILASSSPEYEPSVAKAEKGPLDRTASGLDALT
jgi:8-oxo-dGTP pyrophosphatase MutT (NUDIX family)